MNPTIAALAAAFVAIGVEYLYRVLPGPWIHYLWLWIPCQLFIGFAICTLVRVPGLPLIGAFVTWSFCTLIARVAVTTTLLHDKVSPGTWVAVALIFLAKLTQQVWK